ncbi:MAG: universal stress protein [Coriobacteriia bacterium]|nr:universal stress protein [Coriobacteriia bacterium]
MLNSVLVPVDFSDECAGVLAFARGASALGVRSVVLAHVVESSGLEGPIIAQKVDEARAALQELAAPLSEAGYDVELRVPTGDTFDALTALASERGVDAILAGSHAKGIVSQLVEGSVSERLIRDASVPLIMARFDLLASREDPAALLRRFGDVVVLPTDFSLSASRALMRALEMPKGTIKMLYLLHVLDPDLTGERLRRHEEGAEFHLKALEAMAEQQGIPTSVVIRRGDPQREVLAELDERRATGVITGTRGRNAVQEALMGSVSMTLLRQASCPVLIVP